MGIEYASPNDKATILRNNNMQQERRSKKLIISGIIFTILGLIAVAYSIQRTSGYQRIYFVWSFRPVVPVPPTGNLLPIPLILNAYEILIPWLIIGVVLIAIGAYLLTRGVGSFHKST